MDKEKAIKVEKIVLNVEGTKIPLTLEQAKKLRYMASTRDSAKPMDKPSCI